jgi:5'(3')-deoxyribonucleotidase
MYINLRDKKIIPCVNLKVGDIVVYLNPNGNYYKGVVKEVGNKILVSYKDITLSQEISTLYKIYNRADKIKDLDI